MRYQAAAKAAAPDLKPGASARRRGRRDYFCIAAEGAPRSIIMQPDDPSITPVSTATAAAAFSIFFLLALIRMPFCG